MKGEFTLANKEKIIDKSLKAILIKQLEAREREIVRLKKELLLQKDEIDVQKEIIENQRDVAVRQRDEILFQQNEITASFVYASTIQSAMLSSESQFKKEFADYFILYKPRDIVSGDFYWLTKRNNKLILTAADATGHGVPGAFMSVMGMVFLNEIVNSLEITEPKTILEVLREKVVNAFTQDEGEYKVNAGMDLSLVSIDIADMNLEFSGALNSGFLIREGKVNELKADKMPIGYHPYLMDRRFSNTLFDIQKGDRLYLFSDGFADQFGWRNNKKFMKKNFKKLLLEIQDVPLRSHRLLLENSFNNWKGDLEQVDDIVVIGVQI